MWLKSHIGQFFSSIKSDFYSIRVVGFSYFYPEFHQFARQIKSTKYHVYHSQHKIQFQNHSFLYALESKKLHAERCLFKARTTLQSSIEIVDNFDMTLILTDRYACYAIPTPQATKNECSFSLTIISCCFYLCIIFIKSTPQWQTPCSKATYRFKLQFLFSI